MNVHLGTTILVLFHAMQFAPIVLHAQEQPMLLEALPEHLLYQYTKSSAQPIVSTHNQIHVSARQQWENGRTLRVCLFSGNQTVATLVAQVAGEWNKYSNVKFDFGGNRGWYDCLSPAAGFFQIRIGFAERGYWSTMGNDSEALMDPLAPSRNLESFNLKYSSSEFTPADVVSRAAAYDKTVILHEFGHALGLVHELQNPAMGCFNEIKWEGPDNAIDYFAGPPNFWAPDKVKFNLGYGYQGNFVARKGDISSIMSYPMPARTLKQGEQSPCFTKVNYDLSPLDKEIVGIMYPQSDVKVAGELDIASANVKPLPRSVNTPTRDDALARVKIDLESPDTFIRRDARARLSDLVSTAPSNDIDTLVLDIRQASYRYKLGVAVALANRSDKVRLSQATRQLLGRESNAATDATLKKNLRAAAR